MSGLMVSVAALRVDGGTQPRAVLDQATVEEYREAMAGGVTFPPVTVFYDGAAHWLADGFHRLEAAKSLGAVEVSADVRQGTQRDAVLFSVGANASHGLRRTNADKRRAVERLLADDEWSQKSDRWIAETAHVDRDLVGVMRREGVGSDTSRTFREDRRGRVYPAGKVPSVLPRWSPPPPPSTAEPRVSDHTIGRTTARRCGDPEEERFRHDPRPPAEPAFLVAGAIPEADRRSIRALSEWLRWQLEPADCAELARLLDNDSAPTDGTP